jgi:hypothetical protein
LSFEPSADKVISGVIIVFNDAPDALWRLNEQHAA